MAESRTAPFSTIKRSAPFATAVSGLVLTGLSYSPIAIPLISKWVIIMPMVMKAVCVEMEDDASLLLPATLALYPWKHPLKGLTANIRHLCCLMEKFG